MKISIDKLNYVAYSDRSGSAFGDDHCIRFAFAASMEQLKEGVKKN